MQLLASSFLIAFYYFYLPRYLNTSSGLNNKSMNLQQCLPTAAQMEAIQNYSPGEKLVMVNIIRYHQETSSGESGKLVYQRYVKNVYPLIQAAEGRLIWQGEVKQTVIGDTEGQPDLVFLVEYPSVQNFLTMITSEAYQAVAKDRTMALEYGGLLACNPTYF